MLRGNPAVWWSALALVDVQLVYTYTPVMNDLFDSRPLGWQSWITPVVLAVAIFFAVEAIKLLERRLDRPPSPTPPNKQ